MKKVISNKRKLLLSFMIISIMIVAVFLINIKESKVSAALPVSVIKYDANDNSSVFPDSYKAYVQAIKREHPNWIIKAFYTNLDWGDSVNSETQNGKSRIINSSTYSNWINYSGDVQAGYATANSKAVAYVMDPRNFINEKDIFQFKVSDISPEIDSVQAVEKSLNGTVIASDGYTNIYYNGSSWVDMGKSYSQIIHEAGRNLGVSPTFIASRLRQETSGNILSANMTAINGRHPKYPGYFNFFNIGAYDSSGAVSLGVAYAYKMGWNTPEKAINGGMSKIYKDYIKYGQNTVYFQKFDVANPYGNASALYTYQYMTNILAPVGEAYYAYIGYRDSGMLNSNFTFYIPVYENMPLTASAHPDSVVTPSNYDGTDIVYLDDVSDSGVTDIFKIRSGPGTNYDVIATIREDREGAEARNKFVRTQKGTNGWDRILLSDGREGYVYQSYVMQYNYVHIDSVNFNEGNVTLKLGETKNLVYSIIPNNSYIKTVSFKSSNSGIVSVDSGGNITANGIGSADVTVTTLDGNKTATCKVTVGSIKATNISLPAKEYSVLSGNYINLIPTIEPDNTTDNSYDIAIEDSNIAIVENGKIKGINAGNTKVTFTTKDGSNLSFSITLKVVGSVDVKFDESLTVNDGYVSNIVLSTNVEELKQKIKTDNRIRILDKNRTEKNNEAIIGTGDIIQILDENSSLIEYSVVIYGDVNGDGIISATDYVLIKNHIMDVSKLQGISNLAADKNNDGVISAVDYVLVKNYIMED